MNYCFLDSHRRYVGVGINPEYAGRPEHAGRTVKAML